MITIFWSFIIECNKTTSNWDVPVTIYDSKTSNFVIQITPLAYSSQWSALVSNDIIAAIRNPFVNRYTVRQLHAPNPRISHRFYGSFSCSVPPIDHPPPTGGTWTETRRNKVNKRGRNTSAPEHWMYSSHARPCQHLHSSPRFSTGWKNGGDPYRVVSNLLIPPL